MNFEKIRYSRCPACKQYGIKAFLKGGKYTYKLTCKYCKKKFKINMALNTFVNIFVGIFVGVLALIVNKYIIPIPLWVWGGIAVIILLGFDYFAPLEEIE